jgi:hypothetical protein
MEDRRWKAASLFRVTPSSGATILPSPSFFSSLLRVRFPANPAHSVLIYHADASPIAAESAGGKIYFSRIRVIIGAGLFLQAPTTKIAKRAEGPHGLAATAADDRIHILLTLFAQHQRPLLFLPEDFSDLSVFEFHIEGPLVVRQEFPGGTIDPENVTLRGSTDDGRLSQFLHDLILSARHEAVVEGRRALLGFPYPLGTRTSDKGQEAEKDEKKQHQVFTPEWPHSCLILTRCP